MGWSAEACIIGGGPAGLMAAEVLASAGRRVILMDAMPSVGRKFLLAGKGGLNLTHSEPLPAFTARFGAQTERLSAMLAEFGPDQLRDWAKGLGIETFIGTSGRVFPAEFKAAPLLRAWVRRLRGLGVEFHPRHRWTGFSPEGAAQFQNSDGQTVEVASTVTILALGGASWPRLGSDGGWTPILEGLGCAIAPLLPANCGFLAQWSPHMARHAGTPLKNVALSFDGQRVGGEMIITDDGVEGVAVYALSAALRDAIAQHGAVTATLDLKPDLDIEALTAKLTRPRGRLSLTNWLRKAINLTPAAIALLRESGEIDGLDSLPQRIKSAPLILTAPRPVAEAISTAGGLSFAELDDTLMLSRRPGLFAAGEMLDWEAPTGGYLLTASFSTGHRAGMGALNRLTP